jgi:hypothetical protein
VPLLALATVTQQASSGSPPVTGRALALIFLTTATASSTNTVTVTVTVGGISVQTPSRSSSVSYTQTTLSAPVTGSALSAKSSNSKSTAVNAATVSCADSTDGGLPLKNTIAPLTTTTHDEHSELLSRLMATNLSLRNR